MKVIFCTCPPNSAEDIAEAILKDRLAACVNIVQSVLSKYWWNNQINSDTESLLIMKTRDELLSELMDKIKEIHPYEVPEIVIIDVVDVNKEYLEWLLRETKQT